MNIIHIGEILLAEIDEPKVPPPPTGGRRDDSIGTLAKLIGGCCVTLFSCIFGLVFLMMGYTLGFYGGIIILISLSCVCIGCFSAKFTWDSIQKASGSPKF